MLLSIREKKGTVKHYIYDENKRLVHTTTIITKKRKGIVTKKVISENLEEDGNWTTTTSKVKYNSKTGESLDSREEKSV